jgi:hypothetical protein
VPHVGHPDTLIDSDVSLSHITAVVEVFYWIIPTSIMEILS